MKGDVRGDYKLKKIFYLLIVCLFFTSMISCSNKEEELGFSPPIKHIEWGMTPDEVMKELKLTNDSIIEDSGTLVILSYNNTTILGQEANITMTFDTEYEFGLQTIYVQFSNLNKDDMINQLNKAYGNPTAVDDDGVPSQWMSEKIIDLPQEIQDRFKYTLVDFQAARRTLSNDSAGFSDDSVWRSYQNEPLVGVSIKNKEALLYGAGNMAAYTLYKDDIKYIKLIEKMTRDLTYNLGDDVQ